MLQDRRPEYYGLLADKAWGVAVAVGRTCSTIGSSVTRAPSAVENGSGWMYWIVPSLSAWYRARRPLLRISVMSNAHFG